MQKIIEIHNGIARMPEWRMAVPVDFELCEGENIAIVGPNGGGKSMFVSILTGSHPLLGDAAHYDFAPSDKVLVSDNIKYIVFTDSYGENDSTYYLQQRWNQQEIDACTPTVKEVLENAFLLAGEDNSNSRQWQAHLYSMFDIDAILEKYIILLSSGELRKVQIIKALLSRPRLLIIDNPFIGLDIDARKKLTTLLETLCSVISLQVILVVSRINDIPDFITHIVHVENMKVNPKILKNDYLFSISNNKSSSIINPDFYNIVSNSSCVNTNEVVRMNNVHIQYGNKVIFNSLSWIVKKGEHWAVLGKNGSGKSTLLSLICADNPQSYACDITLFDKKRGSGESIWEIKKHIGYVSPEMHRAYKKNIPAINIVASGFNDTVGLYIKPSVDDLEICRRWMKIFEIGDKEKQPFLRLSSGEQRLVLLARAFVKCPDLLILDEPFHGLDDINTQKVMGIIEAYCSDKNKSLIMVTHYDEELPKCIDNKLLINGK